jgi:hypothetical protein
MTAEGQAVTQTGYHRYKQLKRQNSPEAAEWGLVKNNDIAVSSDSQSSISPTYDFSYLHECKNHIKN